MNHITCVYGLLVNLILCIFIFSSLPVFYNCSMAFCSFSYAVHFLRNHLLVLIVLVVDTYCIEKIDIELIKPVLDCFPLSQFLWLLTAVYLLTIFEDELTVNLSLLGY